MCIRDSSEGEWYISDNFAYGLYGYEFVIKNGTDLSSYMQSGLASYGLSYGEMCIRDRDGTITPKIKISENVGKITNPHVKDVYRFYSNETGKAEADLIRCV